jgi:2-polyprenyl-3-methyl-5-hydroxy-6-metoxy-1,4-benzoquinol methylase
LTRPIDGRVADVNRRVGDVGESVATVAERIEELTRALGAYATTVAESNTYVGVESRRLQQSLEAVRARIDEHEQRTYSRIDRLEDAAYNERLSRAAEAPLERLDGAVANLVNHALNHRGFAAQAGLWFNPPVMIELGEGAARFAGVNERIVEMPYAFGALARRQPPARILEIGSAESTFSLSAATLGYQVTAIDLHPLPYAHPNLESVAARFEDWTAGSDRFDAAFLISTIEHFGLGAYGESATDGEADRQAIQRVRELLADDGFIVLTTPYGRAHIDTLERTYDEASLSALLEGWTVLDRRMAIRTDPCTWMPVAWDEASSADADAGVAMIVAVPADSS